MGEEISQSTNSVTPSEGREHKLSHSRSLRQAENSKVMERGWVGGDAFFGSIESCVELKNVLGLYSTFIAKQNVNYCTMKVLHSVLIARHRAALQAIGW
jgi:hypothetical protein